MLQQLIKTTAWRGITRRQWLKATGVGLGGLALGRFVVGCSGDTPVKAEMVCPDNACGYPNDIPTAAYSYAADLISSGAIYTPEMQTDLDDDEMRITFLGSAFPPTRRAQEMMSIFVEIGPWVENEGGGFGHATDSFVFDIGPGSITNYNALGISPSRMNKVFISHLHGDHMGDLPSLYCFGPSIDRKFPLYVFSHSPSEVPNPIAPPEFYDDGVMAFCEHFREAMRWHTESFSFLQTGWANYPVPSKTDWGLPHDPVPVGTDAANDGFALVPIELPWRKVGGVAYDNPKTGVKITHFPVIHCRQGSMGYKLEWNGLTMIYTSDTRPETNCIAQAKNPDPDTGIPRGVDVFIHEMILPPELLTMKNLGLSYPPPQGTNPAFDNAVAMCSDVEESSHTPQGSFGYLLSQIDPKPKLSVLAHFPVADDTVECALQSVKNHFPRSDYPVLGKDILWATDLMVLRVKKSGITQLMGQVSDYTFDPPLNNYSPLNPPKYATPTTQLDEKTLIRPGKNTYCENGY